MRVVLFSILFGSFAFADDLAAICGSVEAQTSCGNCAKQHFNCTWCADPYHKGDRCQPNEGISDRCRQYIWTKSEMKVSPEGQQGNLPLRSLNHYGQPTQLQPQMAQLKMKTGDTYTVTYKYLHERPQYPISDFVIATSNKESYEKKGIKIKFFVECNGERLEQLQCPGIEEGKEYTFHAEITMERCEMGGDIPITISVAASTGVSGLYVSPACGCDCEIAGNVQKASTLCNEQGDLICGQCVCNSQRGGKHCECPLSTYGVATAAQLENKCRADPTSPVCSNKGTCNCGRCQCDNLFSGSFCECDNSACPTDADNRLCSGNGVCNCGTCKCTDGWERDDCSCTTDKSTCMEGGQECSGQGHCECGKCICDHGFTGAFCGSPDELVAPTHQPQPDEIATPDPEDSDSDSSPEDGDETTEASQEMTASISQLSVISVVSFMVARFF